MLKTLGIYLTIIASGMVKFLAAPAMGPAMGISMWEAMILAIISMMLTVSIITFGGQRLRDYLIRKFSKRKKKRFTKRSRRFVKIWKRWGVPGVAFLTPLLFSPPIGTMLVVAVGAKRRQIMLYMFLSAVFWSVVQTYIWYQLADLV